MITAFVLFLAVGWIASVGMLVIGWVEWAD